MRLAKVFDTSKMTPVVWNAFYKVSGDCFLEDEHNRWTVNGYVSEAEGKTDYDQSDVAACRIVDDWLRADGAVNGEEVLIYHG